MVIFNILEIDIHFSVYIIESYYLTVIGSQKSMPTNINGVFKYKFIFIIEVHFSKPTYFVKSRETVSVFKNLYFVLNANEGSHVSSTG